MPRVRSVLAGLILTFALAAPLGAAGQVAVARSQAQAPVESRIILVPGGLDQQKADDTRRAFREVMQRYPPALGRVLKLDPTLFSNPSYLAPYPALAEFLKMHPEIPRYSGYFLSYVDEYDNNFEPQDPNVRMREQTIRMWQNTIEGIMFFCVFLTVTFALGWLVKYVVGHRRWIRATKLQTEVHSRLLERFSSNEELLAYVKSAAGSHFLQAMPASFDNGPTQIAAPFSRILWSVQAGLVLGCGGLGLLYIKTYMVEEISQLLLTLGTMAVSVGIGFALAALASYFLSHRLGLFDRPAPTFGRSDSTQP